MLKTTYESLLRTNPKTVEKLVNRARSVKNPNFDGSTDPSTWDWNVDFSAQIQNYLYGVLSTQNIPRDDHALLIEKESDEFLLANGVEAWLKRFQEEKSLTAIIRLDVGVSTFNEYASVKENVPEAIVENFALKDYPAQETDKPTINVYNPYNPTSPGVNSHEVEAVFYREDGGYSLILVKDPEQPSYDIVHLDKEKKRAIFAATVIGSNTGWDVKESAIWEEMSNEQTWWRVSSNDIADELNQVWGHYLDLHTFNNNRKGHSLDSLFPKDYFPVKSAPAFDNEEDVVTKSQHWGIGERYSDKEFLSKKWEMYDDLVMRKEQEQNAQVVVHDIHGNEQQIQKPTTLSAAIDVADEETFHEILEKMKADDNIDWLEDQEDKPVVSFLLLAAAEKGTPKMIDSLIEMGANPYYIHRQHYGDSQFSFTSLVSSAIKGNNVNTVEHILNKDLARLEQTNNCEFTLFVEAVVESSFKVADKLLELGSNMEAVNLQGMTAFHLVASGNQPNLEAIQYLMEKRMNPDIENMNGNIASECVGDEWDDLYQVVEDYAKAYARNQPFELTDESIELLKKKEPLQAKSTEEEEKDELTEALKDNPSNTSKMSF